MNQLIIFIDDESLKTYLEIEIKHVTSTIPVFTNSAEYFITLTSMFDDLEAVIICDTNTEVIEGLNARSNQIKKVFEINKENTQKSQSIKCDHYFQLPGKSITQFRAEFSKFFTEIHAEVAEEKQTGEFLSIPMMSLTHFKIAPCSCYSDNEGTKKILNKNEEINRDKVLSFLNLGYEEVYFLKAMSKELTSLLIKGMVDKVESSYDSIEEKFKAVNEVYHTTRELASKLGFPTKVIQVVSAIIDKIAEDATKDNLSLHKYLLSLRKNDELGFRFRLAELSGLIATQIVQNITAAGNDPINKVVFACLFADMTLKDRSHIHIRTSEALAKLPTEVQKEINSHALDASDIVAKSKNVPFEAEKLIKQHHGSHSGVGFPKNLAPQISPLALVVFAAQEIAYDILIDPKRPIDQICDALTERHTNATLINYFKIFKDCLAKA